MLPVSLAQAWGGGPAFNQRTLESWPVGSPGTMGGLIFEFGCGRLWLKNGKPID
jgi:hypothetical protein